MSSTRDILNFEPDYWQSLRGNENLRRQELELRKLQAAKEELLKLQTIIFNIIDSGRDSNAGV